MHTLAGFFRLGVAHEFAALSCIQGQRGGLAGQGAGALGSKAAQAQPEVAD